MANPLTSWKEIAAYLGKGVRTVQRWETQMRLPVRRPTTDRHIVLAYTAELDEWARRGKRNGKADPSLSLVNRTTTLAATLREQVAKVHKHTLRLVDECRKSTPLQLIRTEVKVGLTFARLASEAKDGSDKRTRNQANARKAYETAVRLSNKTWLNEADRQHLAEELHALKSALEALREGFPRRAG